MAVRKLSFICLNHPHTVDFFDDGNSKEGQNDQRQMLLRQIKRRVNVDGMLPQPLFRLAVAPAINDPDFDQEHLYNNDGTMIFAHEKWLAERAKRCEQSAAKARAAEEDLEKQAGLDVVNAMTAIVKSHRQVGKMDAQLPGKGEKK